MKVNMSGTYLFKDKDPGIDFLRTPFEDDQRSTNAVAIAAGVSATTVSNIFYGKTRKPQFATMVRIARSIGPRGVDALCNCVRAGGNRQQLKVIEGGKRRKTA